MLFFKCKYRRPKTIFLLLLLVLFLLFPMPIYTTYMCIYLRQCTNPQNTYIHVYVLIYIYKYIYSLAIAVKRLFRFFIKISLITHFCVFSLLWNLKSTIICVITQWQTNTRLAFNNHETYVLSLLRVFILRYS